MTPLLYRNCIGLFINSRLDIYAYSCLKLLSNRPESIIKQQNPCSNNEIRVPFEQFLFENAHCGPYFLWVTLHCFTLLPFSNVCEKVQGPRYARFGTKHVSIFLETKWRTFKTFYRLSLRFYVFYVIFDYIFNGNHWENARITIIHVYFSALTLAVSLGSSLNPRPGGLGFKLLPRATAYVNA